LPKIWFHILGDTGRGGTEALYTAIQIFAVTLKQLTADDPRGPWQPGGQVDVRALHAAQALQPDGAPPAQVGTVDRLAGTVCRAGQDGPQSQVFHLARPLIIGFKY